MGGTSTDRLIRLRVERGLSMRKASEQMGISLDTLRRVENGAAPNPGRPGGLREDHALTIASFYGLKPWELWPISVGGDPDPKEKKAA